MGGGGEQTFTVDFFSSNWEEEGGRSVDRMIGSLIYTMYSVLCTINNVQKLMLFIVPISDKDSVLLNNRHMPKPVLSYIERAILVATQPQAHCYNGPIYERICFVICRRNTTPIKARASSPFFL